MSHTIARIRELSDSDLIAEHDRLAQSTVVGVDYYLNELARRDQARQTALLLRYTRILLWLTVIVTLATVVSLAVAVAPFFTCGR
jgi:hypothetical protein